MPHVGTWTTSPAPVADVSFAAGTLRMIARVSLGGGAPRVRLSNAFGERPLRVSAASIGLRSEDACIRPGTLRRLTFAGETGTTIAAGALAVSDPADLMLPPLSDVAVSFHLAHDVPQSFRVTGHGTAKQTSYVATPGDHTGALELTVARTTESWFFLSAIEVEAPQGTRGLVAFGDSLTDANISTCDANNRWPDQVARRLAALHGGACPVGIMNQGLGGNRLLHDLTGDSGLRRFDRDVIAQPGVTDVIMLLGVNDLRNRRGNPEEVVTAAQMIAGYRQIALRARAAGLRLTAATLLPFEDETFQPGCWSPERETVRQAINSWVRSAGAFDAVIDLDREMRDPAQPSRLLPPWDCGDHLHPSDAGYRRMGDGIDLALLGISRAGTRGPAATA